jgi:hypothetical protein
MTTTKTNNEADQGGLQLPAARCLSKGQAAAYLGIGATLLAQIGPPPMRLGRRLVYDVVDLDAWLDEHKGRGRAMKEKSWLEKEDCTNAKIRPSGGSTWSSPTDAEYVGALGIGESAKQKST